MNTTATVSYTEAAPRPGETAREYISRMHAARPERGRRSRTACNCPSAYSLCKWAAIFRVFTYTGVNMHGGWGHAAVAADAAKMRQVPSQSLVWDNSGIVTIASVDASDLQDSMGGAFSIVSSRTGKVMPFMWAGEARDAEGDLLYTEYKPCYSNVPAMTVMVYND